MTTGETAHSRSMGAERTLPPTIPDREAYVVKFDAEDALKPMNWSNTYRLWTSAMVCYSTLVVTFDSAVFAPAVVQASQAFGVSEELGTLGTSLFVLGFAAGPMIWAPWSELIGRRWPLMIGVFGCSIFSFASATCKDLQTLLICRFFGGVFSASPLCLVPAVLSDIYDDLDRGTAISVYALTVFVGPLASPSIGGCIATSHLHWRWTLYLPAIMGACSVVLLALFLEETYAPIILVSKAARTREETGNWAVHAEYERAKLDAKEIVQRYLSRPFRMLATEPIVLLVSLYMSFVYGLLYAFLEAYPYVFEGIYSMSQGVAGLPLIAVVLGVVLAVIFIILQRRHGFKRSCAEVTRPEPEAHLLPPVIGAFVFAAALLWFAWGTLSVWIVPTLAGGFVGFGLRSIFLPCFNYLVDAYLPLTASVVAANITLRSSVAAGFPLFSAQLFENLGAQWAGTLLGCLAAAMIPIPLLFQAYGGKLRTTRRLLSRYAARDSDPHSGETKHTVSQCWSGCAIKRFRW